MVQLVTAPADMVVDSVEGFLLAQVNIEEQRQGQQEINLRAIVQEAAANWTDAAMHDVIDAVHNLNAQHAALLRAEEALHMYHTERDLLHRKPSVQHGAMD